MLVVLEEDEEKKEPRKTVRRRTTTDDDGKPSKKIKGGMPSSKTRIFSNIYARGGNVQRHA
jgi:hypothetical protein